MYVSLKLKGASQNHATELTADGKGRVLEIPLALEPRTLDRGRGDGRVGKSRRADDAPGPRVFHLVVRGPVALDVVVLIGCSCCDLGRPRRLPGSGEGRLLLGEFARLDLGAGDPVGKLLALLNDVVDDARVARALDKLAEAVHHLQVALVNADPAADHYVLWHSVHLHALRQVKKSQGKIVHFNQGHAISRTITFLYYLLLYTHSKHCFCMYANLILSLISVLDAISKLALYTVLMILISCSRSIHYDIVFIHGTGLFLLVQGTASFSSKIQPFLFLFFFLQHSLFT
jgi:hypothetical protein